MTSLLNLAKTAVGMDPTKHADPDMKRVLDALASLNPKHIDDLDAIEARQQPSASDAALKVQAENGVELSPAVLAVRTEDIVIDGATGPLPARVYRPQASETATLGAYRANHDFGAGIAATGEPLTDADYDAARTAATRAMGYPDDTVFTPGANAQGLNRAAPASVSSAPHLGEGSSAADSRSGTPSISRATEITEQAIEDGSAAAGSTQSSTWGSVASARNSPVIDPLDTGLDSAAPFAPADTLAAPRQAASGATAPLQPIAGARFADDRPQGGEGDPTLAEAEASPRFLDEAATAEAAARLNPVEGATGAPGKGLPLVLYFHGGGFVIADIDTYDATPRSLAAKTGAIFLSAHYRQAPEHKFPAAHDDAFAAYQWALANAERLGADPLKIAVLGESAGGNLALNVAIKARDEGLPLPIRLELIYPVADTDTGTDSYHENSNARPLDKPMMTWFVGQMLEEKADMQDKRLRLLHADLADLPPTTVITAGIDPLNSEGAALAERLRESGGEVRYQNYPGATHEFFGMDTVVQAAKEAQAIVTEDLRSAFASEPVERIERHAGI